MKDDNTNQRENNPEQGGPDPERRDIAAESAAVEAARRAEAERIARAQAEEARRLRLQADTLNEQRIAAQARAEHHAREATDSSLAFYLLLGLVLVALVITSVWFFTRPSADNTASEPPAQTQPTPPPAAQTPPAQQPPVIVTPPAQNPPNITVNPPPAPTPESRPSDRGAGPSQDTGSENDTQQTPEDSGTNP